MALVQGVFTKLLLPGLRSALIGAGVDQYLSDLVVSTVQQRCPTLSVMYSWDSDVYTLAHRNRSIVITKEMLVSAVDPHALIDDIIMRLAVCPTPVIDDPLCAYPPCGFEPGEWPVEPDFT